MRVRLSHGNQACVVLRPRGVHDVRFEMRQGRWIGKAGPAEQLEVSTDLEATRLIFPCRAVGLEEVAVDEHASLGKRLIAACVDIADGLLATEVMERPRRDDRTGR